jgi:hypothetical protein
LHSLSDDPWHFLTCTKLSKGEVSVRHDDVGRALHHCALQMGIRSQLEPTGLDPASDLRPDLLLSLPGRRILTDVAVCHPLAPGTRHGHGARTLGTARRVEANKRAKYVTLSARRHLEMLPFVVETTGGMGPSAVKLIVAMAEASEEHLAMWSREQVVRQLLGAVAMAVQRGGAMAYLSGYDLALGAMRAGRAAVSAAKDVARRGEEEEEDVVKRGRGEEGIEDEAASAA